MRNRANRSNQGRFFICFFSPILLDKPPNRCIIGVSRVREGVMIERGQVFVRCKRTDHENPWKDPWYVTIDAMDLGEYEFRGFILQILADNGLIATVLPQVKE
jgi:hypothetical protein